MHGSYIIEPSSDYMYRVVLKGDEAYVQIESKCCKTLYPFMPKVHPYKLDESISNIRVAGWSFSTLFKLQKKHFRKQIMKNLIRRSKLRCLIWFCTVCRCPTERTIIIV